MKYRIKEQKKTLVTGITKRLNHDFNNHVTLLLYHGKFSFTERGGYYHDIRLCFFHL